MQRQRPQHALRLEDLTLEEYNGSAYSEILYTPLGNKLSLMNGQTNVVTRVPLPGGSTAELLGATGATKRTLHSDWLGSSRLSTNYTARTLAYDVAYSPYGES